MKQSGVSQPTSPEAQLSQSELSRVSQSSNNRQVYDITLITFSVTFTNCFS